MDLFGDENRFDQNLQELNQDLDRRLHEQQKLFEQYRDKI